MPLVSANSIEHIHTLRREQTRELYAPFESNMKAVSSDVYLHEMPGGQYTNLKFQVRAQKLVQS